MKNTLVAIFLAFTTLTVAQNNESIEESLITDRPDVTESPFTVGKGNFQIESGASFIDNSENGLEITETIYNTTLLRYGLSNNFELRLGWDFLNANTKSRTEELFDATGFNPLLFGSKIQITNENGWIPQIGLLTHLRLPFTAASEFKPEDTGMEMIFAFNHTFNQDSGIGYNLGTRIGTDRSLEYLYSVSYGRSITEKLSVYAELYGFFPEEGRSTHLWDAGFTYLVHNNLQLDATIGTGFQDTNTQQDLMLSLGFSYRILKK